jgi:hypothetical protein
VVRIRQLQRGPAGVEDGDPSARGGERAALGQSEDVAVEVQRRVVVGCRDHQAEFAYGGFVGHIGSSEISNVTRGAPSLPLREGSRSPGGATVLCPS